MCQPFRGELFHLEQIALKPTLVDQQHGRRVRGAGVAELGGDNTVRPPHRPQFGKRPREVLDAPRERSFAEEAPHGERAVGGRVGADDQHGGGFAAEFVERAADLLGEERAGGGAGGGEEGQDRDPPAVLTQRHAPPVLVGECEVGGVQVARQQRTVKARAGACIHAHGRHAGAGSRGRPVEQQHKREGEHEHGRETEQQDAGARAHGAG